MKKLPISGGRELGFTAEQIVVMLTVGRKPLSKRPVAALVVSRLETLLNGARK